MYGARAYLAYLRYGAMRFFQDKILRGHGNFWSRKLPIPYSHKYCTVPYQLNHPGNKIIQNMPNFVTIIIREIHHQNCEMKLPRNFTFGLIVKFYRNKENNFEIYHTAIIRKIRDIFGSVTRPSVGRSVPE